MRRCVRSLLYYPNRTFTSSDSRQVQYQWLPRRLLLVRHGESEANVNREVYSSTPDWRIPLTERGKDQAFDCGRRLRRIIGDEKIYIYYSPYMRTQQTLEEVRKSLDESQIQGEREDERLREQEMGNYQPLTDMDHTWAARNRFSRLYYRFPSGESSADVGDRVSSFFDSLLRERIGLTVPNMNEGMLTDASEEVAWLGLGRWSGQVGGDPGTSTPVRSAPISRFSSEERGWDASSSSPSPPRAAEKESAGSVGITTPPSTPQTPRLVSELGAAADRGVLPPNDLGAAAGDDQNVVIVAHGLLIRLFIGRWFGVPMEVFETMCNPPNCAIVVLERNDDIGRLVMTDISKQLFGSDPLLQMMRFDGREDTQWYRERFLGIIDPDRDVQRSMQGEDDDENHYSKSKTPHEYEPPASLRDYPPVQRPRVQAVAAAARQPPPPPAAATATAAPSPATATRTASSSTSSNGNSGSGAVAASSSPAASSPQSRSDGKEEKIWRWEQAGGAEPNVGPSGADEDQAATKENLRKYLSRGFW